MKTRKELNAEYEQVINQIEKENWVFQAALISMLVSISGFFVGFLSNTFGGFCILLGFFGMLVFGYRCASLSERKKELTKQWYANGYGLRKYPLI